MQEIRPNAILALQRSRKRKHEIPTLIEIGALASPSTGENFNFMTAR
jgi:hypothetical protein